MNYRSLSPIILILACALSMDVVASNPRVRVLLDEQQIPHVDGWSFSSDNGFDLYYRSDPTTIKRTKLVTSQARVCYKRGSWYVNDERIVSKRLILMPREGQVQWGDSAYQGSIMCVEQSHTALLINSLDIEDYVYAVLRTESWPGWPVEVNKVQAIACRSYVVSMVAESKKQKRPYHIKNTNYHQTYTGHHSCTVRRQAVDDTRGIFLVHHNKPIRAMFDSCCGGVIPAYMKGVNFDDAPYLARDYPCTHCKRCKIYSWRAQYTLKEFEQHVRSHMPHAKDLRAVHITKKDKAGIVQEAVLKGKRRQHTIPGKKLYSVLRDVKSFCFGVRTDADWVIFEGRGYGHHLGLCQWGAREMVRDGWDYKRILQFYYPGTSFMKLT